MKKSTARAGLIALAIALPLTLSACSSEPSTSSSSSSSPSMTSSSSMADSGSMTSSDSMTESGTMNGAMSGVFGPGCSAVPKEGAGSFNGMATAPVATAASANPLLATLVTAVKKADLVDTLNSAKDITVFAPTNDAFGKIPKADLDALLADKPNLTKVLTNHVVQGKLSPENVSGTHKTLAGTEITVKGSGEDFTVGKENAKVLCGNVPTANATVYIIDSVLMP